MPTRRKIITVLTAAFALSLTLAEPGFAQEKPVSLRFQTHHSPTSLQGSALLRWSDRVKEASEGRLVIEMHTISAVVKATESFEAAATGIIDGDATGAGYLTGKEPAFQFFGDLMGGYETPQQVVGWFKEGGGKQVADKLYAEYGMHLIGVFVATPESLTSSKPIAGIADLKGWKFRSPPGMESEIFSKLGAGPVVMPFGEVFTAMSTGAVAGSDASTLAVNKGLGLFDIGKHATYPGFHSMPIEHVAVNLDRWEALPKDLQRILEVEVDRIATEVAAASSAADDAAVAELAVQGVTLYDWSAQDRGQFRAVAQDVWADWATRSPMAKKAYESHIAYLNKIGLSD
jgi:TRAP-type C4-dicarboxylate transport system substrate-binding protein